LGRQRRWRPSAMATAVMIFGNHGLTHRIDPGLIRAETAAAIPSETWTSVSAGCRSPTGLRSEQACVWCACRVADLARLRVPKAGFWSKAVGNAGILAVFPDPRAITPTSRVMQFLSNHRHTGGPARVAPQRPAAERSGNGWARRRRGPPRGQNQPLRRRRGAAHDQVLPRPPGGGWWPEVTRADRDTRVCRQSGPYSRSMAPLGAARTNLALP
jgi:hypothetical protein